MSLRALAIPIALVLLLPAASALGAAAPSTETFLVGYEPGAGEAAAALVRAGGGEVRSVLGAIDTLVVALPAPAAPALSRAGVVAFVEPDRAVLPAGVQWDGSQWNGAQWNGAQWDGAQWNGAQWNGAQWDGTTDPGLANGWQWGLEAIQAPAAWNATPGSRSAELCVVDSGLDTGHRDLAPRVKGTYNAADGSTRVADGGGHGTHVAGIAVASYQDGYGIGGVTDSSLLVAKVLDANGTGSASALARGMTWCADNGADVMLLALSVQGSSFAVARAIEYASARNVVMVASAGNAGPCTGCVSYPASDPRVIAVAASTRDGGLAPFSSNGAEVALRAPGVDILSDLPGGTFGYGSGTSQAAAFTAGAATLLREQNPGLPPAAVRAALVAGAAAGILHVGGAVDAATG